MSYAGYTQDHFGQAPLMFYYEVTQACDLICKHCRASAQESADPEELTTDQAMTLIDQVTTFPRQPVMVMTGGDPLKRPDLLQLIRHATAAGLQVALTPSATPLATREAFEAVQEAGIRRLGISLDGADAKTHDAFRGWEGSFARTLNMLADARSLGLPVQINTTITRRNFDQIDAIADLLTQQGVVMWAAFFLIPVGRGIEEQRISPEEYEVAFARLWHHARHQPYAVKTTEAPHYRRFVLEQGATRWQGPAATATPARTIVANAPRWASAMVRASCFSVTQARSTLRVFCRLSVGVSPVIRLSTRINAIRHFARSAIQTSSVETAVFASTANVVVAAELEPTP